LLMDADGRQQSIEACVEGLGDSWHQLGEQLANKLNQLGAGELMDRSVATE